MIQSTSYLGLLIFGVFFIEQETAMSKLHLEGSIEGPIRHSETRILGDERHRGSTFFWGAC